MPRSPQDIAAWIMSLPASHHHIYHVGDLTRKDIFHYFRDAHRNPDPSAAQDFVEPWKDETDQFYSPMPINEELRARFSAWTARVERPPDDILPAALFRAVYKASQQLQDGDVKSVGDLHAFLLELTAEEVRTYPGEGEGVQAMRNDAMWMAPLMAWAVITMNPPAERGSAS